MYEFQHDERYLHSHREHGRGSNLWRIPSQSSLIRTRDRGERPERYRFTTDPPATPTSVQATSVLPTSPSITSEQLDLWESERGLTPQRAGIITPRTPSPALVSVDAQRTHRRTSSWVEEQNLKAGRKVGLVDAKPTVGESVHKISGGEVANADASKLPRGMASVPLKQLKENSLTAEQLAQIRDQMMKELGLCRHYSLPPTKCRGPQGSNEEKTSHRRGHHDLWTQGRQTIGSQEPTDTNHVLQPISTWFGDLSAEQQQQQSLQPLATEDASSNAVTSHDGSGSSPLTPMKSQSENQNRPVEQTSQVRRNAFDSHDVNPATTGGAETLVTPATRLGSLERSSTPFVEVTDFSPEQTERLRNQMFSESNLSTAHLAPVSPSLHNVRNRGCGEPKPGLHQVCSQADVCRDSQLRVRGSEGHVVPTLSKDSLAYMNYQTLPRRITSQPSSSIRTRVCRSFDDSLNDQVNGQTGVSHLALPSSSTPAQREGLESQIMSQVEAPFPAGFGTQCGARLPGAQFPGQFAGQSTMPHPSRFAHQEFQDNMTPEGYPLNWHVNDDVLMEVQVPTHDPTVNQVASFKAPDNKTAGATLKAKLEAKRVGTSSTRPLTLESSTNNPTDHATDQKGVSAPVNPSSITSEQLLTGWVQVNSEPESPREIMTVPFSSTLTSPTDQAQHGSRLQQDVLPSIEQVPKEVENAPVESNTRSSVTIGCNVSLASPKWYSHRKHMMIMKSPVPAEGSSLAQAGGVSAAPQAQSRPLRLARPKDRCGRRFVDGLGDDQMGGRRLKPQEHHMQQAPPMNTAAAPTSSHCPPPAHDDVEIGVMEAQPQEHATQKTRPIDTAAAPTSFPSLFVDNLLPHVAYTNNAALIKEATKGMPRGLQHSRFANLTEEEKKIDRNRGPTGDGTVPSQKLNDMYKAQAKLEAFTGFTDPYIKLPRFNTPEPPRMMPEARNHHPPRGDGRHNAQFHGPSPRSPGLALKDFNNLGRHPSPAQGRYPFLPAPPPNTRVNTPEPPRVNTPELPRGRPDAVGDSSALIRDPSQASATSSQQELMSWAQYKNMMASLGLPISHDQYGRYVARESTTASAAGSARSDSRAADGSSRESSPAHYIVPRQRGPLTRGSSPANFGPVARQDDPNAAIHRARGQGHGNAPELGRQGGNFQPTPVLMDPKFNTRGGGTRAEYLGNYAVSDPADRGVAGQGRGGSIRGRGGNIRGRGGRGPMHGTLGFDGEMDGGREDEDGSRWGSGRRVWPREDGANGEDPAPPAFGTWGW